MNRMPCLELTFTRKLQRENFILRRKGTRIITLAIWREMTTFGVNERHLTLNKATNSYVNPSRVHKVLMRDKACRLLLKAWGVDCSLKA